MDETLRLNIEGITIHGGISIPDNAGGLVIFAHGSGSSRFSPRNNFVSQNLCRRGLATFLFDLLTKEEDETYSNRFNIELLSQRLAQVTKELATIPSLKSLPVGYFGASTGAAAAIVAAATLEDHIKAIVSRGGRPDLALNQLYMVKSPTLFIVGELDHQVVELNEQSLEKLDGIKSLQIVKGATHLFEEPGTLEQVAQLAGDWFAKYLTPKPIAKSITSPRRGASR